MAQDNPFESSKFTPASLKDLPALIELLGGQIPNVSPVTVWQLPWTWKHYMILRSPCGRHIAAAGSLQPVSGTRAEIRGLVVHPSYRGRGLATTVVHVLVRAAEQRGLETICITRNPGFFSRLGFQTTRPTWIDLLRRQCDAAAGGKNLPAQQSRPRVAMRRTPQPLPTLRPA